MKKSNNIDTLRLRALHTACMAVDEIANKMSITVKDVEYELKKMGYTPLYKRDTPEHHGFIKKEENNMPKGEKTPVEKIHEISVLRDEGKSLKEIAEITGVSRSTARRVCGKVSKTETKEEPAPSANDTSSQVKETSTITIVPEIPADVNTISENSRTFSEYSKTAMLWCIRQKEAELEKLKIEICCMKADYVELMGGQLGKEVRQ